MWSGLGYYRRAQQLLRGAQRVVAEFDGEIPSTVTELRKIDGTNVLPWGQQYSTI